MGAVRKELRTIQREGDPRTGVIRKALLTEMHERALLIHLSERVSCLRAPRRTRLMPLLPALTNS